ncbi:MAG: sodium ion-translocating decarboxylase subunit beta [Planctomycetota bacterium]
MEPPSIFRNVGLLQLTWGNVIMLIIGMIFIYLAISKDMEPYELLPIGFGIILGNLPLTRLMSFTGAEIQQSGILGVFFHYGLYFHNILPPLIFLGLGAMTDFGPLIANPKTLIFGAAAQLGIFIAFWGALVLGPLGLESIGLSFNIHEAAAIGIIGGADGPTTIYTSAKVAPNILGITAVCAYTYMALVAIIQPPIMRLLTTKKERKIRMKMLRQVSKTEKILFPILGTFVILLLVPLAAPLLGLFMLGNLFRESGVVPRLSDGAQNELMNIVTIFLMLCIGAWMGAENILKLRTLAVLALGIVAFSFGTIGGILLAKFMNLFLKEKINPLIGSAGVSAVPMAARISQIVGQKEDPQNFLLMHAMGANVAGVIGSAVAAGLFLALLT